MERTPEGWSFGAAATLTRIEEALRADGDDSPLAPANAALLKMLWVFGARPIRNRATLGGNLVNASPIGDMAPVLMALGASVRLRSVAGERVVALDAFFTGYRKTLLRPDEVLCEVLVPVDLEEDFGGTRGVSPEGRREVGSILVDAFKVSRRREMDISVVSAGFRVQLDFHGFVENARLAYGGVAATTIRARQTESALLGQPWTRETIDAVLPVLAGELHPINDVRGSAEYRRGLITSLFEKFFVLNGQPEFTLDRRPLAPPPDLTRRRPRTARKRGRPRHRLRPLRGRRPPAAGSA